MNERRRIIIPTGADPDEPLVSPHFDSEATSHARPVVPLTDQETFQMNYGAYPGRPAKPAWKRPAMLVLIVVLAIGAGVAAGIGISLYRNRQATKAPDTSATGSTGESATAAPVAAQTPSPQSPIVAPVVPRESPATNEDQETKASKPPSNNIEVPPPVVREKTPAKVDDAADQTADAKEEERDRRREERRERRRQQREQDEPVDVPRQVDRAGRGLNRIREIFEGRNP